VWSGRLGLKQGMNGQVATLHRVTSVQTVVVIIYGMIVVIVVVIIVVVLMISQNVGFEFFTTEMTR
jgi:hypothetical protein